MACVICVPHFSHTASNPGSEHYTADMQDAGHRTGLLACDTFINVRTPRITQKLLTTSTFLLELALGLADQSVTGGGPASLEVGSLDLEEACGLHLKQHQELSVKRHNPTQEPRTQLLECKTSKSQPLAKQSDLSAESQQPGNR